MGSAHPNPEPGVHERLREVSGELDRRVRDQRTITEVGELALDAGLAELLDEVVNAVRRSLDVEWVSVLHAPFDREEATPTSSPRGGAYPRILDPDEDSHAGHAFRQGAPVVVRDASRERRFALDTPVWTTARSGVAVPIPGPERPWGVLTAHAVQPRDYGDADVALVSGLAGIVSSAVRRHRAEQAMQHHTLHDHLTGLPNQALVSEHLERALGAARGENTVTAALLVDMDSFRSLNHRFGRAAGNELLVSLAQRLRAAVRPGDTVARPGGDEFVVVSAGLRDEQEVVAVAECVQSAWSAPFRVRGEEVALTGSIGIATTRADGADAGELLREADVALYRAKGCQSGGYQLFDDSMRQIAMRRLVLARELRTALCEDQLSLAYQPIIDINTGRITCVEALARWSPPGREPVSPLDFIPIAEETGLITQLGDWALRTACAEAVTWAGSDPAMVRVNVSTCQLRRTEFAHEVEAILQESGLPAARLGLEITEAVLMDDTPGPRETIARLHALGVEMLLDDFGTGYSSLSYLHQFPALGSLKIDRSFVENLPGEVETTIISAIIALGEAFNMVVIAEGVETAEQMELLATLGCDLAQGFHIARPMPSKAIGELLGAQER
ncbi:MAG: putative bifunctional diguanylate cyclase/phosphodiesterase [Candidatus Dormibacteria bacterium]